jgi:methylthioribose-1-phosphate isomerase
MRDDVFWWEDGALLLLDQRRLPHEIANVRCATAGEVAEAIRNMTVRGAPAIGCVAAYGVALSAHTHQAAGAAEQRAAIVADSARLRATRPTAVNLGWALDRQAAVVAAHPAAPPADLATRLLAEAEAIAAENEAVCRQMSEHGAALVPPAGRVLTHCNAGRLATGATYGTAVGVIRAAWEAGRLAHVYVDETRPRLQGAQLTAWELQQAGIPATLIADNMAASIMRQGRIDAVFVGADRIAANGDTANKIGTYSVAVLARAHGIPFYVVAPTSTVDLDSPDGAAIPIEERAAEEMTHLAGHRVAPAGVTVANPAFDVTPHEWITAIITEHGILYPPFDEGLQRAVGYSFRETGASTR